MNSPAANRRSPASGQWSLTAKKSFKFCFEFILQDNRQKAEESKNYEEQNCLHGDWVHRGGQLLQCGPRLDEYKGGRGHSEEGPNPEGQQWYSNNRRDNVDEPAGNS